MKRRATSRGLAIAAPLFAAGALYCSHAGGQPVPPEAEPLPDLPPVTTPDEPVAEPAPALPPPPGPATPRAALPGAAPPPGAAHTAPRGGPAPPPGATGRGELGGPPFQLTVGRLVLWPVVLVQAQVVPYVGDDAFLQAGDVAEGQGFRLRRARLGFAGRLAGYVPFAVSGELSATAEAGARLSEAWLGYTHFRFANLYIGAHDVPFSRSAITGAGEGALIDRPFAVRAMAPFRQVGLQLRGSFRLGSGAPPVEPPARGPAPDAEARADGADRDTAFAGAAFAMRRGAAREDAPASTRGTLTYYAGMYNGFQRSDQFFAGYVENAASFGNRFDQIAYVARLAAEPLGPLGGSIQDLAISPFRIGAGASYFFSDGGTRDIHAASGDLLIHVAGAHLLGELLWSRSDPETEPTQPLGQLAPVTSLGIVGEVGYFFKRRKLGLSARFEWLDPNMDIDDESDSWVLTAGASYHFIENVLKAQANFTHRQERNGVALENDAVVLQLQLNL